MQSLRLLAGLSSVLMIVTVSASSLADERAALAGTPVDNRSFIQAIEGSYRIVEAGGKAPKPENSKGSVTWDAVESYLTLPFCIGGDLCDAGFVFLPHPGTEILRQVVDSNSTIFTLYVKASGGKTERYTWEDRKGRISFRNYQYGLSDGSTIVLEHVLERLNRDDGEEG